jgi:hypothetical protein
MAYDEHLADRIRLTLKYKQVAFVEKKMMGGLCFMVDEKMCLGITGEKLMARVGEINYLHSLEKDGCEEMNFTGSTLKGFVYVLPKAIDLDDDLDYWIQLCLEYNPFAKSSKKKNDYI